MRLSKEVLSIGYCFIFVVKTTHRVIVLSEETKNYIERRFGKDHSVFVLPNTVNDELNWMRLKIQKFRKKVINNLSLSPIILKKREFYFFWKLLNNWMTVFN